MTSTDTTISTAARLRILADLIEAHPDLPPPYISAYSSGTVDALWYLHINGTHDLAAQKTAAAAIVSSLGGQWDKKESGDEFKFTQRRDDGIAMEVTVARAAVCERVVLGTHEVTVPATPRRPAEKARPATTTTVEDVKWVCSSLLAEPVAS